MTQEELYQLRKKIAEAKHLLKDWSPTSLLKCEAALGEILKSLPKASDLEKTGTEK